MSIALEVAGRLKRAVRFVDVAAKKKPKKPAAARKPAPAAPTVVQLRFQNERSPRMSTPKDKNGRPLHGAALAAHRRAGHKGGGHKAAGRKGNPANPPAQNPGRRRRRRNPHVTFVQAVGKVLGAGAAMFGSGVLVTLGTAKIAPGSPWSMYGIPLAAGALGAAVATRYPLIGAGVAAGGAAPFVLPVASRMLQPSAPAAAPAASTVAALRAVAMGGGWRALNAYPGRGMNAVSMRAVHAT